VVYVRIDATFICCQSCWNLPKIDAAYSVNRSGLHAASEAAACCTDRCAAALPFRNRPNLSAHAPPKAPTTADIPSRYGSRHRAAIGISEITDAITIVVSEETGNVSIAEGGKLTTVNEQQLRKYLTHIIVGQTEENGENNDDETIIEADVHELQTKMDDTPDANEETILEAGKITAEEVIPAEQNDTTVSSSKHALQDVHEAADAAAKAAIESPLLETSIEGATSVIMNFTGSKTLSMLEVTEASEWLTSMIMNATNVSQPNIIWGIGVDENLEDSVRVTVVATGFGMTDGGATAAAETTTGLTEDWISMPGMGSASAPKAAPVQPAAPQAQARPAAAIVPPNTGNAANNRRMNVVEPNAGSGGTDIIDIPAWMRRPR